nr:hypothetical protein [uncultured Desulfobacter sp.]
MDPVDSNTENGFISVSYPLDLVNQAREVMLGANQELFSAGAADISDAPTQFSPLSFQLTSRLNEFSTLLSSTDFFSDAFSYREENTAEETEASAFSDALKELFSDGTDTTETFSALDLEAQEQSVETVIDKYNELIEWLDDNPYAISPSLKADLFKEMNSNVLAGVMSNASAGQEESSGTRVDGEAGSQSQQANPFSPQVSGTSDMTLESSLSKIGLKLNTNGTLEVEDSFSRQFKTDFSSAYDALAGEDGFFTKIGSALDTLNSRDSRFNVYTRSDNDQVYTRGADVQVRNMYRRNIASLLNIFA